MKTLVTTFLFIMIVFTTINAQSNYDKAMESTLQTLKEAKTSTEMVEIASKFERIASVENDKWVPAHYSIYCLILSTFMQGAIERDNTLDKAQLLIDKYTKIFKENEDFRILQAFTNQARMSVKGSRGMTLGPKTTSLLEDIIQKDPANPKAHYLLGSNILNTPKMFGGGKENALPHFSKAKELYDNHKTNIAYYPLWGKERNENLLKKCKNEIGK